MYAVSDKYSTAIKANERSSCIVGTMTALGQTITLDDSMIVKDSVYITNRCGNNNKLGLGSVYSAECGFSLLKAKLIGFDNLVRANYDAKISFEYRLLYDDATYDSVPLGIFYVDSAVVENGIIKITAIDRMYKLDKDITENISDTWYNCVKRIADLCGLSLAQNKETLENLHYNTNYSYSIQMDKIGSFRDAISNLATVVCAFATIDRNGKLMFGQLGTSAADTNDRDTRIKGCKVEDYSVKYKMVKARFLENESYVPYESKKGTDENAIDLDIGDISVVGGTQAVKQEILNNIYDTMAEIEYTPMTLYIPPNPAYDLGDLIECQNSNFTATTKKTYVMEYKFEYRKKETIKSFGENPYLQMIKDKSTHNSSVLESQIEEKKVITLSAKNTHSVTVNGTEKRVLRLKYAATMDCYPVILVSVQFTLSRDGNVYFELHDGDSVILETKRMGYFPKGTHTQTLAYTKADKKDQITNLDLYMWCEEKTDSLPVSFSKMVKEYNKLEKGFITLTNVLTNALDVFPHDKSQWRNKDEYTLVTKNPIRIGADSYNDNGGKYTFKINDSFSVCCGFYDKYGNLVAGKDDCSKDMSGSSLNLPKDAYYIKIFVQKSGGNVTITTDDLDNVVCSICPMLIYNVNSFSYDTDGLSCKIEETGANIIVYSQGIDGETPWDGTLQITDSFGLINTSSVGMLPFTDESVGFSLQEPKKQGFSENIAFIPTSSVGIIE